MLSFLMPHPAISKCHEVHEKNLGSSTIFREKLFSLVSRSLALLCEDDTEEISSQVHPISAERRRPTYTNRLENRDRVAMLRCGSLGMRKRREDNLRKRNECHAEKRRLAFHETSFWFFKDKRFSKKTSNKSTMHVRFLHQFFMQLEFFVVFFLSNIFFNSIISRSCQ